MKVLYIGTPVNYQLWRQGENPSHWLYGACEMEQEGHEVIWAKESAKLWNDLKLLHKHHPELVFIPNLNLKAHVLLLSFSVLGLVCTPIFAYLHHAPKVSKGLKASFYRFLLSGVKHLFFLSELSMKEIIECNFIKENKCSVPGWGADMHFFSKTPIADNGYFVSTGKEQRDFDILIEAFKRTGAPLKIITCKSHAGNNFEKLPEKCKEIPNIDVIITENSGDIYPQMIEAMANAKALVCPLLQDKLNYCVGLSTIVDAEGLRKPLIITHNLYHLGKRVQPFRVVETVDDWVKAIREVQSSSVEISHPLYNMERCYTNMKVVLFKKNRRGKYKY